MRTRTPLLVVILVVVFPGVWSAEAQAPPPVKPWRLHGSLGFGFNQTTNEPLLGDEAEYRTAAGDLRLHLSGFLKDPRLLLFDLDFNGQRGSNSVDLGSYHSTIGGWGVNTIFLPQRAFPLRFYYRSNQFNTSGERFGQEAEYSALGFDWSLRLPDWPRFKVGYTRYVNEVLVPVSLSDSTYRQGVWNLGVEDDWKGWQWQLDFLDYSNVSSTVGPFTLPFEFEEDLRELSARVRRSFWERKAHFTLENRNEWRASVFPSQQRADTTNNYLESALALEHTPKLSSAYSYSYVRVQLRGEVAPDAGQLLDQIEFLAPPTFTAHLASARADYRLTESLSLFEEVRHSRLTPLQEEVEVRDSLTESLSGVAYQTYWGGLDFGGYYQLRYQTVGSNFDNRNSTFSNEVEARLGWGAPRYVRLVGTAHYSKLNLVEQLGGYTDDRRFRLEAYTTRLLGLRLRASAERARIDRLTVAGDTRLHSTNFSLQLDHRLFSLSAGRTLGDGEGALFPSAVRQRRLISVPLPLDELLFTPLLDRTTRTTAANLVLRLRRDLDLRANWRKERNLFAVSDLRFRQAELFARYRLGKFTFEGGVGNYRTEILAGLAEPNGTDIRRYFVRIARDFVVF